MPKLIKARFSKGLIEPLEEVNFKEGELILLSIEQIPASDHEPDAFRRTAGGWIGLVDTDVLLEDFKKSRELNSPETTL